MYKVASLVFLISTVILGALYFSQETTESIVPVQLTSLDSSRELQGLKRQLMREQAENEELKNKLSQYAKLLEQQSNNSAQLAQSKPPILLSETQQVLNDALLEQMEQKLYLKNERLFKKLNLSQSQMAQFMALQTKRSVQGKDFTMALKEARNDEEKNQIFTKMDQAKSIHDQALASLLGNQYTIYEDDREKRAEYALVDEINKQSKKSSLDETSQEQLVSSMNRVANEYSFTNTALAENPRLAKTLPKDEQKTFIKEMVERDKLVLREAVEYLSPEQLLILKNQQESHRKKLLGNKKSKIKKKKQ